MRFGDCEAFVEEKKGYEYSGAIRGNIADTRRPQEIGRKAGLGVRVDSVGLRDSEPPLLLVNDYKPIRTTNVCSYKPIP